MKLNESPFLAKVEHCFSTKSRLFFVMEYINGRNLAENLRHVGSFSEEQTKFIIAQIVIALEDLHSRDVLHRDIKTENILMRDSGYIVLADYGLSKIVKDHDIAKTI
jgi:serine/threonine protein kinase